jgi:hypothetical protein
LTTDEDSTTYESDAAEERNVPSNSNLFDRPQSSPKHGPIKLSLLPIPPIPPKPFKKDCHRSSLLEHLDAEQTVTTFSPSRTSVTVASTSSDNVSCLLDADARINFVPDTALSSINSLRTYITQTLKINLDSINGELK